jgi:hypothetical protein
MKMVTDSNFNLLVQGVYELCGLKVSNHLWDRESKEYEASTFQLNALNLVGRKAKITPKKIGLFVTLWKRNANGETAPYQGSDKVDLSVINIIQGSCMGQFVFPTNVLIEKGILSSYKKQGKRGFRVYPPWSQPTNLTAKITQRWQLEYFLEIEQNLKTDLNKVRSLYLLG